jgi:hypothetical protein
LSKEPGAVQEVDRIGQRLRQHHAHVGVAPCGHRRFRRTAPLDPVPELEGNRDAEPRDPVRPLAEHRLEPAHRRDDRRDRLVRARKGVVLAHLVPDRAEEVDHHHIEAAPPDLGAEKVGAVRVERMRHRRLADLPALRLAAHEQVVGLELAHDHRNGLRRQPGHAGDLGLGERAVPADQRHHQPLVLLAQLGLADRPLGL